VRGEFCILVLRRDCTGEGTIVGGGWISGITSNCRGRVCVSGLIALFLLRTGTACVGSPPPPLSLLTETYGSCHSKRAPDFQCFLK